MSVFRISCAGKRGSRSLMHLFGRESWQYTSPLSTSTSCTCLALNRNLHEHLLSSNERAALSKNSLRLYSTNAKDSKHTDSSNQSNNKQELKHARESVIFEALSAKPDSSTDRVKFNEHEYTNAKFDVIYFLPHIRLIRLASRMKLYQTFITCGALPAFGGMLAIGTIQLATFIQLSGFAAFALVMLYSMTFYSSRIVGQMSLSEDGEALKISHLTFWGKRNNAIYPVRDVVQLSQLKGGQQLIKMEIANSDEHYYFSLRYGIMKDVAKFVHVFGSSS